MTGKLIQAHPAICFFRKDDNPGGSGQTYMVTHPIVVPGEDVNVSGQPVEIGLELTITGTGL